MILDYSQNGFKMIFEITEEGSVVLKHFGKKDAFEEKDKYDKYTEDDVKQYGDTVNWAVGNVPRILPNMRSLKINLNFMTGEVPDWLLYHPRLLEWGPEVLIFPQQEKGVNSDGAYVGFGNAPANFEYYFEKYPKYRGRYEGDISDDKSEGTEGNDDNAEKEE